ncbi:Hypothetical predicted protein [Pelobates cultripes]|uniref:Uncharacterized protein n=1 Tax=Pelobates cultripes TaxID=61616 RepID=A0AAD1TKJ5_PELCU|nr:Hypothetical predicted protein [Pelobates cultripes]
MRPTPAVSGADGRRPATLHPGPRPGARIQMDPALFPSLWTGGVITVLTRWYSRWRAPCAQEAGGRPAPSPRTQTAKQLLSSNLATPKGGETPTHSPRQRQVAQVTHKLKRWRLLRGAGAPHGVRPHLRNPSLVHSTESRPSAHPPPCPNLDDLGGKEHMWETPSAPSGLKPTMQEIPEASTIYRGCSLGDQGEDTKVQQ